MAKNLNDINTGSTNKKSNRAIPSEGSLPARSVMIIDLGIQPRKPYKGEAKAPHRQFTFIFELPTERIEIDGESKPQWMWMNNVNVFPTADKGKFFEVKKVLGGANFSGNIVDMLNVPVMCNVVHATVSSPDYGDRVFANIDSLSPPPKIAGFEVPPLENEALFFDFDEPTEEGIERLPDNIITKLKQAVNYEGSLLQSMLEGSVESSKEDESGEDDIEDELFN